MTVKTATRRVLSSKLTWPEVVAELGNHAIRVIGLTAIFWVFSSSFDADELIQIGTAAAGGAAAEPLLAKLRKGVLG